ncbi:response regulator [Variovorax sp. J22P168]|uniref:hybrid sensor histidine kinase/response regulator n=1 Tax=Variovorax jilinensis TaxID=3053513 RepID=UPI002575B9C8|nr:response regulator [Variovorax sp. J22P168]MDM0015401.1 response regulator [Variovorax sp. J22P168]
MVPDVITTTIDRGLHTVLVVDDNPTTRYSTARVIRAAGFQTREAATGREALELAGQHVSAVVLDVHLPDFDGFEVCRTIRADVDTATLPVIHLSAAFIRNEDKVTGLDAGADAYLVHPVEPAVLIATLQALIRARMAEERLRSSESRFRAIYAQAPTGMALIDDAGRFVDVNPAMVDLLRRSRDAIVGESMAALAPEDWSAFVRERSANPRESAATWQAEFPLRRQDGSLVRLEWTMSTHIEPGLRIGIALDVSERFELETRRLEVLEREQAARAAAERHSRTKDDFIAVLSHELRNPLNAIGGWVHVLKTRNGSADLLEKGLTAIDRSVKSQARLISDILDVSRISSGKLRLHCEWSEPRALVASSIEALGAAIAAKRLNVQFDREEIDQPAWLDPTRFQQIVWNLLSNAVKFSEEGGLVRISLTRNGDRLNLCVQDFGRGIDAVFLTHLFDRFTQSDSPDNRFHGGLGLGLSIVKNLAELHGGSVSAESEGPGFGATLRVELVVVPADGPQLVLTETQEPKPALLLDRVLDGVDVLVVEDNADASEMLTLVLADAGAQVRLADNCDEALRLISQQWPDVLVSDIGLPGRDGYELIRLTREHGESKGLKRLFAVALTAFARPQDRDKALEAGFDAHLGKPLQPHVLMGVINARAR